MGIRHAVVFALCCAAAVASEDEVLADAIDRAAGGDPKTMTELLHWGLQNTNLDELHAKAEAIRSQEGGAASPGVLSAAGNVGEVGVKGLPEPDAAAAAAARPAVQPMSEERRVELDELARVMMPNMVEEMRRALAIAEDETAPADQRLEAFEVLQEHVEDIDNARDFNTIGGFDAVIKALALDGEPRLQTAAAWVAGTAVQNNRELQLVLAGTRALPSLLKLLEAHAEPEVRAKALFAVSGMLRGCPEAQAQFTQHDGFATLLGALADSKPKLVRKALVLLADLLAEGRQPRDDVQEEPPSAEVEGVAVRPAQDPAWGAPMPRGVDAAALLRGALHNSTALCDAVLACLRVPDVDTQDKAVRALEQMVEAGLMAAEPAAQPDSCAEGVRTALRAFGTTCAAAGDDGCGDEDLLPLVRQLEGRLAPDS